MEYLLIIATLALTFFPLLLAAAISTTHSALGWRRRRRQARHPRYVINLEPEVVNSAA